MCAHQDNNGSRLFLRLAVGALALSAAFALWNVFPTPSVANEALEPLASVDGPASFANLIEAVQPAVVNISVSGLKETAPVMSGVPFDFEGMPGDPFEDFLFRFFDRRGGSDHVVRRPFEAMGTGFIIDPAGLVVTNHHVIDEAEEIWVTLDDGSRHAATLRGFDDKTDLALLEIDGENLPFVAFGDSDVARVGDWIVAIGNPFGLGGSATTGIISARGRDIQAGPFDDFLQIDAPINTGNSGGPLFDLEGKVIGVNTMIYSPNGGNVGIGFAIPSAVVAPVIDELSDSGRVSRGWLGVSIQGMDEDLAAGLGLTANEGALVAGVVADGPADRAGVVAGDVILGFNGEAVEEVRDLVRMVAAADPSDDVEIEVWRGGEALTLGARLASNPDESNPVADSRVVAEAGSALGMQVRDLDDAARRRYRIAADVDGVVVTMIERGGPAFRKQLRPGDVIAAVDRQPVETAGDYQRAVAEAGQKGRASVVLQLVRGGQTTFVALPLG